ncbi:MAG TPA: hypothetical protein VEK15_01085 [Vicinamibacteria bacterium]|nr:hypothetical protein [Vicinamibacteria bacterium]
MERVSSRARNALKGVDVHRSPNVSFGTPRTVLDRLHVANLGEPSASPDGQRFLFADNAMFARSRSLSSFSTGRKS